MIKKKYTIDEVKYSRMIEDIAAGRIGVDK
jgi:hypothetical protein